MSTTYNPTVNSSATSYSLSIPQTGYTFSNTTVNTAATWTTNNTATVSAKLQVNGDAEFDGDVKIKGKDLMEILSKIEDRLAILHPNPELEGRWEELKELSKRYRELEAELLAKEQVWAILKK